MLATDPAPPAIRHFCDTDAGTIRRSILLGDTDEWAQTDQRVRVFRNGSTHFAMCECSNTGKVHPAVSRIAPGADAMPGCAILISLTSDQADELLEALGR